MNNYVYDWIATIVEEDLAEMPRYLRATLSETTAKQAVTILRQHMLRCSDYLYLKSEGKTLLRSADKDEKSSISIPSDLLLCHNYAYTVVKKNAEVLGIDKIRSSLARIQQTRSLMEAYMVDEYTELLSLGIDLFGGATQIDLSEIWPTVLWRIPNAHRIAF